MSSYKKRKEEEDVKYNSISDLVKLPSKQSSLETILPKSSSYQIKGNSSNYSSSNSSYNSYSSQKSTEPLYTSPNTGFSVKSVFN